MDKEPERTPTNKRARLFTRPRADAILALSVAGLTQAQIATKLKIHPKTVAYHLKSQKAATEQVKDLQQRAADHIEKIMPIEKRIDEQILMLNVAKATKQPAAGSAILSRLDDMQGFVTLKELTRAKQSEQPANQAMFILAPGMNISFGPSSMSTDLKSVPSSQGTELKDVTNRESHEGGTVNKDEGH